MATVTKPNIQFKKGKLSKEELISLYRQLVYPRVIEDKMLILLRQGKISKWFSGIGQEAISVGCAAALLPDELIFTMHRNLGVFTTRQVPFDKLFAQWQGKKSGFSKGRERSFHFGTMDYGIVGMISHLGPQLALAGGGALGHKLSKERKVSFAYQGLNSIPEHLLPMDKHFIEYLDLTENNIDDLRFLIDFTNLRTLIIDRNRINSNVKIPRLDMLHT
ncbi:MAG TPA: thiamine pyrophosphate-dependent enzyme, partial [Saprospiraceae bacterium]|nr:thiamine pyrophosphate-dependent enzyme [Saprospiraceae bacterium]